MRENDRILDEITRRQQNLRKTNKLNQKDTTDHVCLHDRLMSEIKQKRILKPIGKTNLMSFLWNCIIFFLANQSLTSTTNFHTSRKRIRPVVYEIKIKFMLIFLILELNRK